MQWTLDMVKMAKIERFVGAVQKGRGCGVEMGLQPTKKFFFIIIHPRAPFPGAIHKIL